ncbi:MAG: hypothetical protein IKR86_02330 [Candidatus Methanomethylophilaceae archaeon]|nr:hypothetical protein [Candidatus Methanomethylophilaceae archaeon]
MDGHGSGAAVRSIGHDGPDQALGGVVGGAVRHPQAVYPAFGALPVYHGPDFPVSVHGHEAPASA